MDQGPISSPSQRVHPPTMSDRPFIVVIDGDGSMRKALTRLLRAAQMGVETYASCDEFLLSLDGHDLGFPRFRAHMVKLG